MYIEGALMSKSRNIALSGWGFIMQHVGTVLKSCTTHKPNIGIDRKFRNKLVLYIY